MAKGNRLPDSLELLLDTMCNTFGGIMFIAISLVVISQLITNTQKAMTREDLNEATLKGMQKNIDTLQLEVSELQRQVFETQRRALKMSPEVKELIEQYLQARESNLHQLGKLNNLEAKISAEQERVNRLKSEIAQAEAELKEKKEFYAERQKQLAEKKQELQKAIAELEAALKRVQPRTLRFSQEEDTSLDAYWVLLKHNKIYRYGSSQSTVSGEVIRQDFNFGRSLRLLPQRGTALGENPAADLEKLFGEIPRNRYFIFLLVDHESFSTLLATRQYLRNCRFMVRWSVNPEFELVYSNDVQHKASQ